MPPTRRTRTDTAGGFIVHDHGNRGSTNADGASLNIVMYKIIVDGDGFFLPKSFFLRSVRFRKPYADRCTSEPVRTESYPRGNERIPGN